jgi:citronellyl-CoA dehydrogenase
MITDGTTSHPLFTPDHEALREAVRRWVTDELAPHVDVWEQEGFPDAVFRRAGELGFLGLHWPEQWGGAGGDLAASIVFVEEVARAGTAALAMALSVQTDMATPALAVFGTDEQRDRYLRPAIAGDQIAAIAITEPDAGSDVAGIRMRAVRDADDWILDGTKLYITNALRADWMTVVARTDPGAGHRGISLFLVDTHLPGISMSKLDKLGMRSSDTAEVVFDGVRVPSDRLIGETPGEGFSQLMHQLQYERLVAGAACVGHADWVLDQTVAFANSRETFGKAISNHQVIAHKLADAATELAAARSFLYSTVWRVQQGEYPVAEISMAKKFCAQVQNRLIDDCLQVHGGAGFMEEYPVARAFRDARLQRIGGGTDEIMNEVIAKRLGIVT